MARTKIVAFIVLLLSFTGLVGLDQCLPLYYWNGRSNFGDALSEAMVERMIGRQVRIVENPFAPEKKLLGMGSILSYAQDGDVIWGTGVNGKTPLQDYRFSTLDVRAVRGPLTRKFLLEKGIECPEVYGDPALLLPRLFPEFQKPKQALRDYCIVPHFSDEHLFLGHPNLISVGQDWKVVVQLIIESDFVISSSLSGIIVAEAFGIPARLVMFDNLNNTENLVKYEDYYLGTQRPAFRIARTIDEALEMGGEPAPRCNLVKLYQAFPFDKMVE